MRSQIASRETATAIVTMPPPSAIAVALSQTGLASPTNREYRKIPL
jgi:hypothetical protein